MRYKALERPLGWREETLTIKRANWLLLVYLLGFAGTQILVAFLGISSLSMYQIIQISLWMGFLVSLPPIIYGFLKFGAKRMGFVKTKGKNIVYSVLLAFFISVASIIILTLLGEAILRSGGTMPDNPAMDVIYGGGVGLVILLLCVQAPLTEEILMRGIFQNAHQQRIGFAAVVLASVIFGLNHGDLLAGINGVICGFALGYLFYRTGSLWTSIIFHFAFNFFAGFSVTGLLVVDLPWVIFDIPTGTALSNPAYMFYIVGWLIVSALCVFALILLLQRSNPKPEILRQSPPPKQRGRGALAGAVVIVAVLMALGTIVYWAQSIIDKAMSFGGF